MRTFWLIIVPLLAVACRQQAPPPVKDVSRKEIRLDRIQVDTLIMHPRAFSGSGFFKIRDGYIYFFDDIYYTVSKFDTTGQLLEQKLGRGSGPNEVLSFEKAAFLPDGGVLFVNDHLLLFYTAELTYRQRQQLDFGINKTKYRAGDASLPGTYTLDYNTTLYSVPAIALTSNRLYLPVTVNGRINPELSYFNDFHLHAQLGRRIAQIELPEAKIKGVFALHDPAYRQTPTVVHDVIFFSAWEEYLYATQGISPQITVYSLEGEPRYRFGYPGKDMNTQYVFTRNFNETAARIRELNRKHGFYYHLYADQDYVFRAYSRGGNRPGGLQIYQGTTLIGDVEVPLRFNVAGKIGNRYYADGWLDEEQEVLGIFTFTIDVQNMRE